VLQYSNFKGWGSKPSKGWKQAGPALGRAATMGREHSLCSLPTRALPPHGVHRKGQSKSQLGV
jgi:hypothetical protein